MSKTTGIWLIVAAALVLCGGLLFGGVMMFGLDFTDLSTERYETNTYAIGEEFENISIATDTAEVIFAASEGQTASVVCYEQKNAKHAVGVQDGTLTIEVQNTKRWYEYIGINLGAPKITVYLPATRYGALSIREHTGNVVIPGEFTFENLDVKASTGQVICRASVMGSGNIQTTTGRILVENASFRALDLSVSTGKITATAVTCPEKLSVRVTTGAAELTDIACGNLLSDGNTGVTNSMDMNLGKLREIVEDREAWRVAVHGVPKSQTRLSD